MSIKNPFESYIYNTFLRPEYDAFNEGIKAANEDWVEQMQIQQGICHTHRCEFDHKVCDFCGATCNWWQSLKQSILNAGKN